ncbi:ABC transporter ATP-binding protein [Thermoflexus sp.]|uniref:ABC transporter ATP-binding protein n=1 Tax=Thermoflexus sp. TaxID=1969742 RepID=UPI0025E4FAD4|nr:ABC transporter ATP-binding protein [Thermoflexus sp.]MDW8179916.1 ABC transporter ATP-binding protein [Anaerolineae bacterium]MCS6963265.1 ABC transporter ATP-binding protein [Thermoflexus sp.]MCS7350465.1 ABC transporter ATP-binding protein [Thermoflexus sp.]MCX7689344.1 ABC transporter ATP-binding protein [Thermoflexus sp.]MDW8185729.1 ABC transporter ATP-binding protein [Anaerolineae bacterium]
MDEAVIRAEGLTRRFGTFTAVDHVSFEVRRGEIFGFLGPNGAGKTTTIRMLLGLLEPTEGRAWVLGHDATRETARIRPRIGYVSQRFSLYPDLSVEETLRFYGAAYGLSFPRLADRIPALLELLGLTGQERRLVRHLAGGWRQRVALAVALLHEPEIVFLDEPTAGMDPLARREIWSLLYRLAEQGITVFVTTHYMDEAEQCSRLALIHNGRLILQGAPTELKAMADMGRVLEIAATPLDRALALLRGWSIFPYVTLHGARIHVYLRAPEVSLEEIRRRLETAGLESISVEPVAPSLEDIFLWVIERERFDPAG